MKKNESGKKISSINEIFNPPKEENLMKYPDIQSSKRKKDKIAFLELLNTKFNGIGLEDYREYDFKNIGE